MSGEGLNYNDVYVNEIEGEAFRNLIIKKYRVTNDYNKRNTRKLPEIRKRTLMPKKKKKKKVCLN